MYSSKYFLSLYVFLTTTYAHMRLLRPLPRGHPSNNRYSPIDFDLVAPLVPIQKPFACGGKTTPGGVTATWRAGETVTIEIEGSTTHDGGHCQFSLDCTGQSRNFIVIGSALNRCPIDRRYPVKIPEGAHGRCVFSWSWLNAIGNREFYQNCADVEIIGPENGSFSGPPLTVANLPGFPRIPERGLSPYDINGIPNNLYGQATETGNNNFIAFPPGGTVTTQTTTTTTTTSSTTTTSTTTTSTTTTESSTTTNSETLTTTSIETTATIITSTTFVISTTNTIGEPTSIIASSTLSIIAAPSTLSIIASSTIGGGSGGGGVPTSTPTDPISHAVVLKPVLLTLSGLWSLMLL